MFFLKAGTKLLLGVIIALVFLTLAQCTIKAPESPTWTTHAVVPVVNRTYPMGELLRKMDQEGLGIDDSGRVIFSLTEELDTVSLDEDALATADLSFLAGERLGPVDLEIPALAPVTVRFAQLGGLGLPFIGDSVLVEDTTFTIATALPPIASFRTATLARGRLDVTIDNELDLTLDNISLDLVETATGAIIGSGASPDPLPSGAQAQVAIPLDGATIASDMTLVAGYHTLSDTVRAASGRYLRTGFAFGDTLQAVSATARIPALARADSTEAPLAETDRLDSAYLASGVLNLTVHNATNLEATVTVSAPDFSYYGQPLAVVAPVAARSQAEVTVDLSGYALQPAVTATPQHIRVIAGAAMPGSGDALVAVDQTDSFTVAARISDVTFHSVTGVFQSVRANFDGLSQDLDIPTGLEQVELTCAVLTLTIDNGIDLPGAVNVSLTGDNGAQTTFVSDIAPRGLSTAATTTVVNDSAADFLYPLPTRLDVSGSISFGNGAYYGTITRSDFVVGRVSLYAPLEMVVHPTVVETDITGESIDQTDIDLITDHFLSGRFVYRLTSRLPIGAHVNVFLGGDSASLFSAPQLRFDSLGLAAAPVGPGGIAIDTIQSAEQEILLDSVDIRILKNPVLYAGHQIMLAGSDGQTVTFTADDYLSITGRLEIDYLFDGDF